MKRQIKSMAIASDEEDNLTAVGRLTHLLKWLCPALVILAAALVFFVFDLFVCNGNALSVLRGQVPYSFSFFRTAVYILVLAALFIFRKSLARMAASCGCFTRGKTLLLLCYCAAALLAFFGFIAVLKASDHIVDSIQLGAVAIVLMLGLLALLLVGQDTAKNALVIGFTCVLAFPFFTLVNHGLDEYAHFLTAYNVSLGRLLHPADGAQVAQVFTTIPIGLHFNDMYLKFQKPVDYSCIAYLSEDYGYSPTSYPSIFYFPATAGLLIARVLHMNAAFTFFSGRLFNIVLYVLVCYLILRKMPFAKNLFFVFLFAPLLLLLSSTYSIDGIGMVAIMLYAAYCFDMCYRTPKLKVADLIVIAIALIFAVLFKSFAYAPIVVLTLLIPFGAYIRNPRNRRILTIGFFLVLAAGIALLLYKYMTLPAGIGDKRGGATVDEAKQLRYILGHPLSYALTLAGTIYGRFFNAGWLSALHQGYFFGRGSGFIVTLFCFWTFVAVTDQPSDEVNFKRGLKERILVAIYIVSSLFLIFLGLYLSFTPVGASSVGGVQPRYIYPVLPFLFLLFIPKNLQNNIKNYNTKVACAVVIITVISQLMMLIHQA